MTSYHNTLNLPNTARYEEICNRQELYVYKIFQANPKGLTASEVVDVVFDAKNLAAMDFWAAIDKAIDIDKSVRRSISNLCDKHNLLVRTDQKRSGRSGRDNSVYKLII